MNLSKGTFQAWRQSAARVSLHPAWPVPIELNVLSLGWGPIELQCIVQAYNALDVFVEQPLMPWTDLPTINVMLSQTVPDIPALETLTHEVARLRYIRARLHETALHELNEFLLVDGRVAVPPHEVKQAAFEPMPLVRHDEISTWRSAITRVSLHPAFRMQIELGADVDQQGLATISCDARHSDPNLAATVRYTATSREHNNHVQQLLALVRHTTRCLLDECLIVDGCRAAFLKGLLEALL